VLITGSRGRANIPWQWWCEVNGTQLGCCAPITRLRGDPTATPACMPLRLKPLHRPQFQGWCWATPVLIRGCGKEPSAAQVPTACVGQVQEFVAPERLKLQSTSGGRCDAQRGGAGGTLALEPSLHLDSVFLASIRHPQFRPLPRLLCLASLFPPGWRTQCNNQRSFLR